MHLPYEKTVYLMIAITPSHVTSPLNKYLGSTHNMTFRFFTIMFPL